MFRWTEMDLVNLFVKKQKKNKNKKKKEKKKEKRHCLSPCLHQ